MKKQAQLKIKSVVTQFKKFKKKKGLLVFLLFLSFSISLDFVKGMDQDEHHAGGMSDAEIDAHIALEEEIRKEALTLKNHYKTSATLGPFRYGDREIPNGHSISGWVDNLRRENTIENTLGLQSKNYAFSGISVVHQKPDGATRVSLAKSPYIFISGTKTIETMSHNRESKGGEPIPPHIELREYEGNTYRTRAWLSNEKFEEYVFGYLKPLLEREIELRRGDLIQNSIAEYYLRKINSGNDREIDYTFGHTEYEILDYFKSPEGRDLIKQALFEGRQDGESPKAITLHIISKYDMCGNCLHIAERELVQQIKENFGTDPELVPFQDILFNVVSYGKQGIRTVYFPVIEATSSSPLVPAVLADSRPFGREVSMEINLGMDSTVTHVAL